MEADDTPSIITNGGGSGLGVPNGSDPSTVRDPSKSISVSLPVVDMEEMNTLKKEVEHWKGKYEKQRQEMHDLENQLSEYNKMVSDLKAKNDNFMRQVNEHKSVEQGEEFEKEYFKNQCELSSVLQEEYRNTLQAQ